MNDEELVLHIQKCGAISLEVETYLKNKNYIAGDAFLAFLISASNIATRNGENLDGFIETAAGIFNLIYNLNKKKDDTP